MKNYDEMSDFDINSAVAAIVTGGNVIEKHDMAEAPTDNGVQVIYKVGVHGEFLDYCNNPSDAWPIIFDRKIAIGWFCGDKWRAEGDNQFMAGAYKQTTAINENPLRAAMICFLKMKDAENAA